MRIDLDAIGAPQDLTSDVAVIGAGVAGIVLTRRLLAAGREVLLLESGGTDYEAAAAALNQGQSVGMPYYPLDQARLRFFGGTTAIWGGRCAELDPIDLERRDWVPGSGWPIAYDELRAYYGQARSLFGLPEAPPDEADFARAGLAMPPFAPNTVRPRFWTFDARFNRFTYDACADLRRHPRCTIVMHATVTSINADCDGRRVISLTARTAAGARLTVRPRVTVLACGGIENARLLLASRSVVPTGLGNRHDQVGRYFMEHPHARGGRIIDGDPWTLLRLFGKRHRIAGRDVAALLAPAPGRQRRDAILNSSLTIVARQPADATQFWGMRVYGGLKHDMAPTRAGRTLWMGTKKAAGWAQRHIDPLRPWLLHKLSRVEIALLVRAEQAPNPNSRVTLGEGRDAFGMPQPVLDWRMTALDKSSVAALIHALGEELPQLGLGRVERAAWLDDPDQHWRFDTLVSAHPIGGFHHIGTTRMANDPRHGVTDAQGRVHGIANLYVVGSSTFPTSGWANPTLTIAAMALRTADRIAAAPPLDHGTFGHAISA
ncbi:FAD-dependent oxidoreductase [Rhizorhapis sp. SPR117]|uniref:FAD-dependent oxidoreductase n=1 Tax=Rhizorhapis sp. SPR117 TaxID=2912611 RepID=UPI001F20CCD9|nr:GMC family oxidoreductase [Rhizorhapis sp. SPR117]